MNKIILIGRLTRDPEARTTTTGKAVTGFSVAVDRRFKPKDGGGESADFFRCNAWGNTAEFVANYLTKGRLVSVEGRIERRRYTANDGTEREVWEVTAEDVRGLDRPKDDDAPKIAPKMAQPVANYSESDYDPFEGE